MGNMQADTGAIVHSDYISITIPNVNDINDVAAQILAGGRACQEHEIFRLAVSIPNPPQPQLTNLEIFRVVSAVVPHWNRRTRVALILASGSDPLKEFALLATHNRGIAINIFATEAEALAFLRG